ncbi:hypothetical protein [Burkholderia ubonensis]|uniref:hypothetical protein n=1 Tax=Burkholderia ubonensis TaxID=101571 RepID=UPI00075EEBDE|nr:hypothetical protein [Burkholderia ubonensis]KVQ18756.1 hypothetical protein WK00_28520 [Burkholderia ubonensis]
MINSSVFTTLVQVALVSVTGVCQAGSLDLAVGKQLFAQELKQYANVPTVALESQSFKILSTLTRTKAAGATSGAVTQVINERGVVGECHNNVVVSQVAVGSVKQVVAGLSPTPMSAQYYGHMNISTLYFASFQAAVNARAQLKKALPQARVDVPIQYAKPVVR